MGHLYSSIPKSGWETAGSKANTLEFMKTLLRIDLFRRKYFHYFLLCLAFFSALTVRLIFLIEFPFAFGHADSSQYLNSVKTMLGGGVFIPEFLRVNATYAYFSYGILKILGTHSFHIVVIQTFLGLLGGV